MTFPYIKWDSVEWTANFVAVITTPVYMKMISILVIPKKSLTSKIFIPYNREAFIINLYFINIASICSKYFIYTGRKDEVLKKSRNK